MRMQSNCFRIARHTISWQIFGRFHQKKNMGGPLYHI